MESKQWFEVKLSREELVLIRNLAQNPHPNYEMEPTTVEACKRLFNDVREVLGETTIEDHFCAVQGCNDRECNH